MSQGTSRVKKSTAVTVKKKKNLEMAKKAQSAAKKNAVKDRRSKAPNVF